MFSLYYGVRLCLRLKELYQQVAETIPHLNSLDCGLYNIHLDKND